MSKLKRIRAKGWTRYKVNDLFVAPNLAGAIHRLTVERRQVEIRLPSLPKKHKLPFESDAISCTSWYEKPRGPVPRGLDVHSIDIIVGLPGNFRVPPASIGQVIHPYFEDRKKFPELNRALQDAHMLSSEAFSRWLRGMRWKTANAMIGRPKLTGTDTGWGTYLLEARTEKEFYCETQLVVVPGQRLVTKRQWTSVQRALDQGLSSPVWIDFLYDARYRLAINDLRGCVLSLTIACESLASALLLRHFAKRRNEEFVNLVNLCVNIGRLIDKWEKLGFRGTAWDAAFQKKKLQDLFRRRNKILHRGDSEGLCRRECNDYVGAAERFIVHGDKYVRF